MAYFDDLDHAREYLQIAAGYDGRELVDLLLRLVDAGADVLELGMGPGTDLDLLLGSNLQAVGSDAARPFLDLYQERGGLGETLLLDAVTIETDRRFDAVYSNKVLQHLSHDDLARSLVRQSEIIRQDGILLHSLWYGSGQEQIEDLLFIRHDEDSIRELLPANLELSSCGRYTEDDPDDSLWIVLERRDRQD